MTSKTTSARACPMCERSYTVTPATYIPTFGGCSRTKSSSLPVRVLWTRSVMKPVVSRRSSGGRCHSTDDRRPSTDDVLLLVFPQLSKHRQIFERRRIADRLRTAGDVAQQAAHDLAAAGLGQGFGVADVVGAREGADLLGDVLAQLLLQLGAPRVPGFEADERRDGLPLHLVRSADHCGLGNRRMTDQGTLHFHRAEPVAGDVHHVVDAAHDPEVAIFVAPCAVAGEVHARGLAPVLLHVAVRVAVDGAQHAG